MESSSSRLASHRITATRWVSGSNGVEVAETIASLTRFAPYSTTFFHPGEESKSSNSLASASIFSFSSRSVSLGVDVRLKRSKKELIIEFCIMFVSTHQFFQNSINDLRGVSPLVELVLALNVGLRHLRLESILRLRLRLRLNLLFGQRNNQRVPGRIVHGLKIHMEEFLDVQGLLVLHRHQLKKLRVHKKLRCLGKQLKELPAGSQLY